MVFIQVHATLFDTLSGFSEIDHPLCDECTEALVELLEQQLKLAQINYNDYCTYFKKYVAKFKYYLFKCER